MTPVVGIDYLTEKQYANGLWEPTVSYQSVNGLMKVSTFFNSKKPFPNPDKAIESAMQVLSYTHNKVLLHLSQSMFHPKQVV